MTKKNAIQDIQVLEGEHMFSLKNVSSISDNKIVKNSGKNDSVIISRNVSIKFETERWYDETKEGMGKAIIIPH
ncbi:hypothetical protein [Ginsengibacter hankyongi]|uniref:hypothetical protein n=1 Tax=Ginsengibacter hankyongi TaxID=2607284 RepID=UPI001926ECDD|nr:hypothetical protein [Ginsengibacter hankyongi]